VTPKVGANIGAITGILLINTKEKMMIELASAAPNPTSIKLTKQAIEKEYQKAIAEVCAEKDRNMKNINDKSRSVFSTG
jgi:hypothetical protein